MRDGRLVRGYLERSKAGNFESLVSENAPPLAGLLRFHSVDSDQTISVLGDSLKAWSSVKSFERRKEYNDVEFFDKQPLIGACGCAFSSLTRNLRKASLRIPSTSWLMRDSS